MLATPVSNVHALSRVATLLRVICVREEKRWPPASRSWEAQSPSTAAIEIGRRHTDPARAKSAPGQGHERALPRWERSRQEQLNRNCNPNCMIRGSSAVWILPKLALFRAVTGPLKLAVLRTLKTSHRNCTD